MTSTLVPVRFPVLPPAQDIDSAACPKPHSYCSSLPTAWEELQKREPNRRSDFGMEKHRFLAALVFSAVIVRGGSAVPACNAYDEEGIQRRVDGKVGQKEQRVEEEEAVVDSKDCVSNKRAEEDTSCAAPDEGKDDGNDGMVEGTDDEDEIFEESYHAQHEDDDNVHKDVSEEQEPEGNTTTPCPHNFQLLERDFAFPLTRFLFVLRSS